MPTLQELRNQLQKQEARKGPKAAQTERAPSVIFPHWNAPTGSTTTIRFLPDADENNTFFWRERHQIKIKFDTTDNRPEPKWVTLPCLTTWGEECELKKIAQERFREDVETARKLGIWPKTSYVFQGLVVEAPAVDDNAPENPVRVFLFTKQLFGVVKDAVMDPEMEDNPIDYKAGRDFRVKKTQKGEYADYSTSSFAMKTRELDSQEWNAVQQWGLFNLEERLGAKPTPEEHKVHQEILRAYIEGETFRSEWAEYV